MRNRSFAPSFVSSAPDLRKLSLLLERISVVGVGAGVGVGDRHVPRRTETSASKLLAVAKSCLPSLLKSTIATEHGSTPTLTPTSLEPVKPPAPFPKRIRTVSMPKLTMARSCLPSLLKSLVATEKGEKLVEPAVTSAALVKRPVPSPI